MTMPRAASLLVGMAAGLLAALWLVSSTSAALSIVQAVAVLASAITAMLATVMGGLVMSDWQADIQSRRDWAQLGLTPAELSNPVQLRADRHIYPSYQTSADNEALLAIFRAHRAVQPIQPERGRAVVADGTAAPPGSAHANHFQEPSRNGVRDHALRRPVAASDVRTLPGLDTLRVARLHVKRTIVPARLVANGLPWQGWVTHEPSTPKPVALSAGSTAEIITLNSSEDAQARRPASVDGMIEPATEAPSCRGPPRIKQRLATRAAATPAKRAAGASKPASDGEFLVRDNLGEPVPVCATEVAVIDTYLGGILDELLASSKAGLEPERA